MDFGGCLRHSGHRWFLWLLREGKITSIGSSPPKWQHNTSKRTWPLYGTITRPNKHTNKQTNSPEREGLLRNIRLSFPITPQARAVCSQSSLPELSFPDFLGLIFICQMNTPVIFALWVPRMFDVQRVWTSKRGILYLCCWIPFSCYLPRLSDEGHLRNMEVIWRFSMEPLG